MSLIAGNSYDTTRQIPKYGGFNFALLHLEIRRILRNRRTMISVVLMPVLLTLLFPLSHKDSTEKIGLGNLSAFLVLSLALYAGTQSAAFGGSIVAIERLSGWSRQLRITPLSSIAYIAVKALTSLLLSLLSICAVFIVAFLTHQAHLPAGIWAACAACIWVGSLVFAAFGIFMGYLFPGENASQIISFAMLIFSFAGGIFIPLSQFPHVVREIAYYTPLYGLNELVHYPSLQSNFDIAWVLNAVVWFCLFFFGAAWKFREDTKRV